MTDGNNPWQKIVEPKFAEAMKWCREQPILKKLAIWVLAVFNFIGFRNVEIRLTYFFIGIAGLSAMIMVDEWKAADTDSKLQAIASIFGNALGVIGAVFAVYIAIKASNEKDKNDIDKIRSALSMQLLINAATIRQIAYSLRIGKHHDNYNNFQEINGYIASIKWEIFDYHYGKLHVLNEVLPIILRNVKQSQSFVETVMHSIADKKSADDTVDIADLYKAHFKQISKLVFEIGHGILMMSTVSIGGVPDKITKAFAGSYDDFESLLDSSIDKWNN